MVNYVKLVICSFPIITAGRRDY